MARPADASGSQSEKELHRLLTELDSCEELLELMDELGLDTREAVESRVETLHRTIDAWETA